MTGDWSDPQDLAPDQVLPDPVPGSASSLWPATIAIVAAMMIGVGIGSNMGFIRGVVTGVVPSSARTYSSPVVAEDAPKAQAGTVRT